MSMQEPNSPDYTAIQTLRTQLTQDLHTFLEVDPHIAGYIVAWIGRNSSVANLEDLVDELDDVFKVAGRSILGRRERN